MVTSARAIATPRLAEFYSSGKQYPNREVKFPIHETHRFVDKQFLFKEANAEPARPGTESHASHDCFGIAARMNFGTIFNLVEPAPIEQVLRRKRLRGRSESGIDRHGPAVTANAYPASHTLHTHSIDSIHRMAMLKVLSQCLWKI